MAWILAVQCIVVPATWWWLGQQAGATGMLGVQLAGLAMQLGGLACIRAWAMRPARQIVEQVQALGEWRFMPMKQPTVQEWVPLARAVNVLIEKVQTSLRERDDAVGDLRNQLARDDLTHASSRQHFMWSLDRLLQTRDATGAVAILRVNDLEGLNQRMGRQRTDELLVAVATAVRAGLLTRLPGEDCTFARLNGADFGLLVPERSVDDWRALLQVLADGLQRLSDDGLTDLPVTAWIGGTCFQHGETLSQVLARVDSQVMQAIGQGRQVMVVGADAGVRFQQASQWRQVIEYALDTGHLGMTLEPVHDRLGRLSHHHGQLHLLLPDGARIGREEWMPAAVRCGRIADLDLKAVEIALNRLSDESLSLSLELMPQSLARPILVRRLGALLQAHPQRAGRLTLELADLRDTVELLRALRTLGELASRSGCRLGLRDFGVGRTALPMLAGMRLRHAKLSPLLGEAAASATDGGSGRAFADLLREWGARAQVEILEPRASAEL
ncbi:EAL domain-containing protein [Ideonella sp. DXS22W]|uniref:EAL domain-containing protein n=1 Tax=Pseudaquabacterium inlustre TaxID=2984192 RepID=A0ABU9CBQ9_9BURK